MMLSPNSTRRCLPTPKPEYSRHPLDQEEDPLSRAFHSCLMSFRCSIVVICCWVFPDPRNSPEIVIGIGGGRLWPAGATTTRSNDSPYRISDRIASDHRANSRVKISNSWRSNLFSVQAQFAGPRRI